MNDEINIRKNEVRILLSAVLQEFTTLPKNEVDKGIIKSTHIIEKAFTARARELDKMENELQKE